MMMRRRLWICCFVGATTATSDSSATLGNFGFLKRNTGGDAGAFATKIDFELSTKLAQAFAHAGNADAERRRCLPLYASRAHFDSLAMIDDFERLRHRACRRR